MHPFQYRLREWELARQETEQGLTSSAVISRTEVSWSRVQLSRLSCHVKRSVTAAALCNSDLANISKRERSSIDRSATHNLCHQWPHWPYSLPIVAALARPRPSRARPRLAFSPITQWPVLRYGAVPGTFSVRDQGQRRAPRSSALPFLAGSERDVY